MNIWNRVHRYFFFLTICILVVSLLLPGCGGGAVVEEEEVIVTQEEDVVEEEEEDVIAEEITLPEADIIFINGQITTMEPDIPQAEAIAISKDIISAVGSNEEILSLRDPETNIVDLSGLTLYPALSMLILTFSKPPIEVWRHLKRHNSMSYRTGPPQ